MKYYMFILISMLSLTTTALATPKQDAIDARAAAIVQKTNAENDQTNTSQLSQQQHQYNDGYQLSAYAKNKPGAQTTIDNGENDEYLGNSSVNVANGAIDNGDGLMIDGDQLWTDGQYNEANLKYIDAKAYFDDAKDFFIQAQTDFSNADTDYNSLTPIIQADITIQQNRLQYKFTVDNKRNDMGTVKGEAEGLASQLASALLSYFNQHGADSTYNSAENHLDFGDLEYSDGNTNESDGDNYYGQGDAYEQVALMSGDLIEKLNSFGLSADSYFSALNKYEDARVKYLNAKDEYNLGLAILEGV